MRASFRTFTAGALLGAAALLSQSCSSGCDGELIDDAVAFIDAHQSCETDEDCVDIGDFCEELPGGWCGQKFMNRAGAVSVEWRELSRQLRSCAPSPCTVCGGLFLPQCSGGVCATPL